MQYDADFVKNIYSHSKTTERKKPKCEQNRDVTCFL